MKKILTILIVSAFFGLCDADAQDQLTQTDNSKQTFEQNAAPNEMGTQSTDVTLDGYWQWTASYANQNTNVIGGTITNNTSYTTSGTLRMKLYFTNTQYSGGTITGWVLFDHTYGTLAPNNYVYNIDWTSDWVNIPAQGNYYSTLILLEYQNGDFYIIDYLNTGYQNFDFNTGINEIKEGKNISVYPNPSNGLFTISNPSSDDYSIEVHNSAGQLLLTRQATGQATAIDIQDQAAGVYFITLTDGQKITRRKLVKN